MTKKAILPSELTGLPYAIEIHDNICRFAFNPEVGAFEFDAPFLSRFRGLPDPRLGPMPPRPDSDQRLMPWTEADITRLGLKPTPEFIKAIKTTYKELGGAS